MQAPDSPYFFSNFHSHLCSQMICYLGVSLPVSAVAPIFQLYGLWMNCINSTPVKTSTCPCVLLPGAFCAVTAFTDVHVVPNPLCFRFKILVMDMSSMVMSLSSNNTQSQT